MRKYFDKYTLAGAAIAFVLWLYLAPTNTVAGVIQAIIPAAVPTAFKQGATGTKFLIANGAFSTNDCVQIDGNGNASSAGGACGIAGGGSAFNAITSGTNTTATMVVGTSASLNYTATGTINASSLQGKSGLQGNGSNVQLAGTVSGTSAPLCTDANGNTTTSGCPAFSEVLITETLLGSPAANFTFSSIPGTYRHLILRCEMRGDTAAVNVTATTTLNSDTGADYDVIYLQEAGNALSNVFSAAQTGVAQNIISAANAPANYSSAFTVLIQNYS